MQKMSTLPTFLGAAGQVDVVNKEGRLMSMVDGRLQEVVMANAQDLKNTGFTGVLEEGFYLVGSGNTGAAPALATCGMIYAATMMSASLFLKKPYAGYATGT